MPKRVLLLLLLASLWLASVPARAEPSPTPVSGPVLEAPPAEALVFPCDVRTALTLELVNPGQTPIRSVTVTPIVSNDVAYFPFRFTRTDWVTPLVNGTEAADLAAGLSAEDLGDAAGGQNRGQVILELIPREDAPSGRYPLRLRLAWQENGREMTREETLYVQIHNSVIQGSAVPVTLPTEVSQDPLAVSGQVLPVALSETDTAFTLELTLTNTGICPLPEIAVRLSGEEEKIAPERPADSRLSAGTLEPGASQSFTIPLRVASDLAPGTYTMIAQVSYTGEDGPRTLSRLIDIPLGQAAPLTFSEVTLMPASCVLGGSADLMVNLYNTSGGALSNVMVRLDASGTVIGDHYFVGTMEPGSAVMLELTLRPMATGDLPCRLAVGYEDAEGHSRVSEAAFTLPVAAPVATVPEEHTQPVATPEASPSGPLSGIPRGLLPISAGFLALALALVFLLRALRHRSRSESHKLEDGEKK